MFRIEVSDGVEFETPSRHRAAEFAQRQRAQGFGVKWIPKNRFRIKMAKWPTNRPIILKDAHRLGFRGQYRSLEDACRAMDNRIRLERGMPERIDWAHFRPVTPHVEASEHDGRHVQGCVSCYAAVEKAMHA